MKTFRTILGLPFAIVCYILAIPACLFADIACKIRGKDYPLMKTDKKGEIEE